MVKSTSRHLFYYGELEHTLQKKAISKQWLGHLPFVDLPKEKENTTKKEPRINNQKSSFRSPARQIG